MLASSPLKQSSVPTSSGKSKAYSSLTYVEADDPQELAKHRQRSAGIATEVLERMLIDHKDQLSHRDLLRWCHNTSEAS